MSGHPVLERPEMLKLLMTALLDRVGVPTEVYSFTRAELVEAAGKYSLDFMVSAPDTFRIRIMPDIN